MLNTIRFRLLLVLVVLVQATLVMGLFQDPRSASPPGHPSARQALELATAGNQASRHHNKLPDTRPLSGRQLVAFFACLVVDGIGLYYLWGLDARRVARSSPAKHPKTRLS